MFGFGGKKKAADTSSATKRRSGRSDADKEKINNQLAQLGLIGIPGIDGDDEDDISDGDLENELMDMLGEDEPSPTEDKELLLLLQEDDAPVAPKRKNRSPEKPNNGQTGNSVRLEEPVPNPVQKMDTTPTFMAEPVGAPDSRVEDLFKAPLPPTTVMEALQQRLEKYKGEADKAGSLGDASKSRRMGRIVKQYEDAIKSHQRGKEVAFDELPTPPGFAPIPGTRPRTPSPLPPEIEARPSPSDVMNQNSVPELEVPLPEIPRLSPQIPERPPPPAVSTLLPIAGPSQSQNSVAVLDAKNQLSVEQQEVLQTIYTRQKAFKEAAVNAKHGGQVAQAKELLRISKGFDKVISDCKEGQNIDLDTIPSTPDLIIGGVQNLHLVSSDHNETEREHQTPVQNEAPTTNEEVVLMENIFKPPPPPTTILEALEQRLEKYQNEVAKAEEKQDAGKTRRMGRIVKQYKDAITSYKKGKHVEFEELPTPPGFAPIPVSKPALSPAAVASPSSLPNAAGGVSPAPSASADTRRPTPPKQTSINRGDNKPGTKLTLQEKQLNIILDRQKQFKIAALQAKNRGEVEQAKEFLRTAMGFDRLIGVSRGGLPVDMATLPAAPESVAALEAEDFELVSSSDCIQATGSAAEVFSKLEADLREQMAVCMRTRNHLKSIGDIGSANRFEQMAIESKKDLDALRLAVKKGDAIPKYHYENKIFSITECNSDLGEDDIEISILKGINFKTTEDVDTYIKVELPYPSAEEMQTNKTAVTKNSNNPDYNATFKMSINRGARNLPRFVHRHGFKLEVWSKGGLWYGITRRLIFCRSGLFRRDTLIGVANVKLSQLETKCTLHDAFDILDGRKVVGKIEAKVRLRDPVLTKEITQKKQKWVSIDKV